MMNLEKILKSTKGVDAYRIAAKKTASYEAFFVHKKLETVRATDTEATNVTVYVNHDGKTGDSSFAVYGSNTETDVQKKVLAAVERANLVFNEPYTIPEKDKLTAKIPSNLKKYKMKDLAEKIADAVYAADREDGGSLNAVEIFLYRDTVSVKNSNGVNMTEEKYRAMIEAIPTWTENGESVELYEAYNFTEFDAAKITVEIGDKMQEVRDRQHAQKMDTPATCRVVLRPKEIADWMQEIVSDLNFASVYAKSNLHQIGDDLQEEGKGDKLNLSVCGQLIGSTGSAAFDADGVRLNECRLVENGIITNYFGSNRFAQYLGKKATGELRCLKVEGGTLTQEELLKEPYLECVSMSGLQVDLYNDYIGGEIRLAYLVKEGKKTPVTGISMSAKISDVLKEIRIAEKTVEEDNYTGPEKMMLSGISII